MFAAAHLKLKRHYATPKNKTYIFMATYIPYNIATMKKLVFGHSLKKTKTKEKQKQMSF